MGGSFSAVPSLENWTNFLNKFSGILWINWHHLGNLLSATGGTTYTMNWTNLHQVVVPLTTSCYGESQDWHVVVFPPYTCVQLSCIYIVHSCIPLLKYSLRDSLNVCWMNEWVGDTRDFFIQYVKFLLVFTEMSEKCRPISSWPLFACLFRNSNSICILAYCDFNFWDWSSPSALPPSLHP